MDEINIDMNPFMGAILKVLTEPYEAFLAKLKAEGRITAEEVADLHRQILDRLDRLASLTKAELRNAPPADWQTPD